MPNTSSSTSSSTYSSGYSSDCTLPFRRGEMNMPTVAQTEKRTTANSEGDMLSNHPLMARATSLWEWDGVIPYRRTLGLPLRPKMSVDICTIIDADWCLAHHQGVCKYVPRAFLSVKSIYEKRFQASFDKVSYHAANSMLKIERGLPLLERLRNRLAGLLCSCLPKKAAGFSRNSRPPVPAAPFKREPYEAGDGGSHLKVTVDCKPLPSLGLLVIFRLDLSPHDRSRFTGLSFDAILPAGYVIAGVSPEEYEGASTATRQRHSQSDHLVDNISTGLPGALATVTKQSTFTQRVEYTRVTKSIIRGGGVNTSRATWVASEDSGGKSGLNQQMEFKILLRTARCPPTIKYLFTAETQTDGEKRGSQPDIQQWKCDWIEEQLP